MTTGHIIRLVVIASGGIFLMVVPFFRHRVASMKGFPLWALVGWFVSGATAVLYVTLGVFVQSLSIHDRRLPLLTHLRSVIAGMVMGIIITWLI
jgi:hypothetical protein